MKVLITGAKGQVGTKLRRVCKDNGISFVALSKKQLDIRKKNEIIKSVKLHKPSIIINAAAYTNVDFAEKEKDLAYEVNALGAKNLAEVCKTNSLMLIHLSTDYIFDGKKDEPYHENDNPNPLNVYGKTKLDGEIFIKEVLIEHIILRTSWVFSGESKNFMNTILDLSKTKDELRVVNDQYGSPTSALSIANAILKICKHYNSNSNFKYGTYHFSGKPECTWYYFAKKIIDVAITTNMIKKTPLLKSVSSKEYKTASIKPPYSILACEKILNNFSIQPSDWINDLNQEMVELGKEIYS